jgi:hypothetical protein
MVHVGAPLKETPTGKRIITSTGYEINNIIRYLICDLGVKRRAIGRCPEYEAGHWSIESESMPPLDLEGNEGFGTNE